MEETILQSSGYSADFNEIEYWTLQKPMEYQCLLYVINCTNLSMLSNVKITTGLFCKRHKGTGIAEERFSALLMKLLTQGFSHFVLCIFLHVTSIILKSYWICTKFAIINIDFLRRIFSHICKVKWTQSVIVLTKSAFNECLVGK